MKRNLIKTSILTLATLIAPAVLADANSIYFMADNVIIEEQSPIGSNGNQEVVLSFDVPCWASFHEFTQNTVLVRRIQELTPPVALYHVVLGAVLDGNPMIPCMNTRRETGVVVVNTTEITGPYGFVAINAVRQSSDELSNMYFMAKPLELSNVHKISDTHTGVTLNYEVPCWASAVIPVESKAILGNPMNPAANMEIAWGMILSGNPMMPCASSTAQSTDVISYTMMAEGHFLGFKPLQ